MEEEFLFLIDFKLFIDVKIFDDYYEKIRKKFPRIDFKNDDSDKNSYAEKSIEINERKLVENQLKSAILYVESKIISFIAESDELPFARKQAS